MAYNDTLTNKSSKTIVKSYTKSATTGNLVSISTSSVGAESNDIDFSSDSDKGAIRIFGTDAGTDVPDRTFWAYDVTVEKQLPLKSQQNVSNTTTSTTTASTESHIILKFKMQVSPRNLTLDEFRTKRSKYLFDYEDTIVSVSSHMFDEIKTMQFTDISYQIPGGEETAYYDVAMIEVTETEASNAAAVAKTDEQTKKSQAVATASQIDY
ncbi:MAG: hypothetical protein LLG05_14745 [Porphyromonadaceae bacterium]|nr:hypothetical protein [Porphyromonadaceae bacterium]